MIDLTQAIRRVPSYNPLLRTVGYLMRLHVEDLIARPDGEVGLRRATRVPAMAEIAYAAYDKSAAGLFSRDLREKIALRLQGASLRWPQESKFRDILDWDADKRVIYDEMHSNLNRLFEGPTTECLTIGMDLHILWQTYALNVFGTGYQKVFGPQELWHPVFRERVDYIEQLFGNRLSSIVRERAA